MPYVLIHKQDRRVFSCTLINVYQLPYYGAAYWETAEEANAEAGEWLKKHGESHPDNWELLEVDEHQLKLLNVKLANNPARLVRILPDGRSEGYSAN